MPAMVGGLRKRFDTHSQSETVCGIYSSVQHLYHAKNACRQYHIISKIMFMHATHILLLVIEHYTIASYLGPEWKIWDCYEIDDLNKRVPVP